jgi:hypothetical protein
MVEVQVKRLVHKLYCLTEHPRRANQHAHRRSGSLPRSNSKSSPSADLFDFLGLEEFRGDREGGEGFEQGLP